MTRDEILNMEAGREMDALVAEKVMGQTDFRHPGFYWQEKNYADGDGWEGFYCPNCDASQGDTGKCCQRYSHDIAAAWEVVEKLFRDGKHKEFLAGLYAQGVVDLDKMVHHTPDIDCRAALLAVLE